MNTIDKTQDLQKNDSVSSNTGYAQVTCTFSIPLARQDILAQLLSLAAPDKSNSNGNKSNAEVSSDPKIDGAVPLNPAPNGRNVRSGPSRQASASPVRTNVPPSLQYKHSQASSIDEGEEIPF